MEETPAAFANRRSQLGKVAGGVATMKKRPYGRVSVTVGRAIYRDQDLLAFSRRV